MQCSSELLSGQAFNGLPGEGSFGAIKNGVKTIICCLFVLKFLHCAFQSTQLLFWGE
jgi:hypothetical protein